MEPSMMLLVPLLVLGVVMAFAFAGCGDPLGEDEIVAPERKPVDDKDKNPPPPTPPDAYPKLVLQLGGSGGPLRSYWRLGELAATQEASDSEPTMQRPGTYHGSPVLRAAGVLQRGSDPNDFAVEFNGVNAYVEVKNDTLVNPQDAFSLEAWIRPDDALPVGIYNPIIASYHLSKSWGFLLWVIGSSPTLMKVQIQIGDGVVTSLDADLPFDPSPTAPRGGWHHIVATLGPDAGVKKLRLYVNNDVPKERVDTVAEPLHYKAAEETAQGDAPFRIGAGPGAAPTTFFRGQIDEVALYDRALVGSEVAAHFLQATTK